MRQSITTSAAVVITLVILSAAYHLGQAKGQTEASRVYLKALQTIASTPCGDPDRTRTRPAREATFGRAMAQISPRQNAFARTQGAF